MRFFYFSFAYQKSHNQYIDKRVLKVKGEGENVSLYFSGKRSNNGCVSYYFAYLLMYSSNKYTIRNNNSSSTDMKQDSHSDSELKEIFQLKNIAVVGMSKNEEKAGCFVPEYLIAHGFVIPVNPTITKVLGRKSYPTISDIPEKVEVLDMFRKSEDIFL